MGAARTSYFFGGMQGGLDAFTDQPLALKGLVPFRTHGTAELSSGPLFVLLPWLTGALKDPKARNYFLALGGRARNGLQPDRLGDAAGRLSDEHARKAIRRLAARDHGGTTV
jgi:hypothetical protein